MLSVSIRQIEYVVAIAEHGGVTSTADALHVSQSALSVAISRLEEHLVKPLFIRRKGCAVVPTSFGRIFLEESNQILQSLTRLVEPGASKAGQYQPIGGKNATGHGVYVCQELRGRISGLAQSGITSQVTTCDERLLPVNSLSTN